MIWLTQVRFQLSLKDFYEGQCEPVFEFSDDETCQQNFIDRIQKWNVPRAIWLAIFFV